MPNELLANLNPAQLKAVTHGSGPLLIVAGAGTGKTTVLINRLAYLILEKKINPDDLLLLTFTEKATKEMEERADKVLPYGYFDLWINTFHGFSERLLRQHGLDIGLNPDFKLLNTTEQWVLIKRHLDDLELDYYRPLGNPNKFIHEIIKHFSRLKDENISPQDYLDYADSLEEKGAIIPKKSKKKAESEDGDDEMEVSRIKELARAYEIYNQLLLDNNYLDFGDLIFYTLRLFRERPNILKIYSDKFKYIMVDEFQDTNMAQYELLKMLAGEKLNLTVVGDDDQAIYKFRGASISNILQFKDDYPQAKEIILTENYRSNQEILDKAYHFIQNNNPNRLEDRLKINKRLVAKRPKDSSLSPRVKFISFNNDYEAAAFVVEKIKSEFQSREDVSWMDFAILVRANDTADKYIKELKRQGLPYQFVSLKGLYFKPIILDIISYFRLLDNYHESSALFRVLNMDVFKVPYEDLVNIHKTARTKVWSLYEALKNISEIKNIAADSVNNINNLLRFIEAHSGLVKTEKPSRLFVKFVYDIGLFKSLDHDKDQEIFSYLNQFYQKIKEFEAADPDLRLNDFVEMIDLELEAGETGALRLDYDDADVVKVMTIHAAKGLEFKYVFVVDLVDKRFPTINRGERISIPEPLIKEKIGEGSDFHLEEERRLFYVAMTRAKDELYLTAAKDYGGARDKKPSRFIEESGIDPETGNYDLPAENDLWRDVSRLDDKMEEKERQVLTWHLPERFSFSQLAAYSSCPLQYKLAFILRIPAPTDKPSLIFGHVMHEVLREFMLPLLVDEEKNLFSAPDDLSVERILGLYEKHWVADGYGSRENREKYWQKGQAILSDFVKKISSAPAPRVLLLEKDFVFKINGESIKGAIDRVDKLPDGTLEILDYKTGNPKEKLEWKDKRQLILYQLFLEDFLKTKVSALSYYYLENGEKISFIPKPKEIEKLQQEIIDEIKAIKSLDFAPTPDSIKCQFCDFKGICEFKK